MGSVEVGRGGIAVVDAERGAGKTRLMLELGAAPDFARMVTLQGEPNGVAVPYLPFRLPMRELLGINADDRSEAGRQLMSALEVLAPKYAPLAPLLAPVVDAELAPTSDSSAIAEEFVRERIAEVLVSLLEATCPRTLLIVAEDAHWFDTTSSEVTAQIAQAARARPWLFCATRRSEPGGFEPSDPDLSLSLAPLADDAARGLVDAATEGAPLRPHEREGIVARASGNPLFLEELLRIARDTGVDALPDSLDAVAMREIDALPATARRVLRLSSVLGRSFPRSLLAEFLVAEQLDRAGDAIDDLAGLLVADGDDRLRFRHALLQESAYQSLPFRTRLALHRRAAETIEHAARGTDDVAPLLSLHFLEAQDWEQTWRYARLAARVANEAHAPGDAATHLERAVTAARRLDDVTDGEIATVLVDLGETLLVTGVAERADDAYRRAYAAAKLHPVQRARIAERRSYLRYEYQGRLTAAIRQVRTGSMLLDGVSAADPEVERVRAALFAAEAEVRLRQGRLVDAVKQCDAAIEAAEHVGELRVLAIALTVRDESFVEMGCPEEATHMPRVIELYETLGDQMHVARALNNFGGVATFQSKWHDAAEHFARAAECATAAGDVATAAIARMNLAEIRVGQGRLAEAEALVEPALKVLESFGFRSIGAALTHLGRARAFQGALDDGLVLLRSAVETAERFQVLVASFEAQAHLAEVLVFAGNFEAARAALDDARRLERVLGHSALSALLDRIEVTLAVASGDTAGAIAKLAPALRDARDLRAMFDVLLLLTLADRLGVGEGEDERLRLSRDLGVVRLPMLPEF
jgi:tetratricopeptide (TPR) repeat protein